MSPPSLRSRFYNGWTWWPQDLCSCTTSDSIILRMGLLFTAMLPQAKCHFFSLVDCHPAFSWPSCLWSYPNNSTFLKLTMATRCAALPLGPFCGSPLLVSCPSVSAWRSTSFILRCPSAPYFLPLLLPLYFPPKTEVCVCPQAPCYFPSSYHCFTVPTAWCSIPVFPLFVCKLFDL